METTRKSSELGAPNYRGVRIGKEYYLTSVSPCAIVVWGLLSNDFSKITLTPIKGQPNTDTPFIYSIYIYIRKYLIYILYYIYMFVSYVLCVV